MRNILLELDPIQAVLLTDILEEMDRAGQVPRGKGLAVAGIRMQLANPSDAQEAAARIKAQALHEAQQAGPAPTGLPQLPPAPPVPPVPPAPPEPPVVPGA